ncbi:MAG: CRISPR-associated endonuclease Cas2 [Deltaproteobacteria bacterium]|nr:CRISPR-associated endonuclease Cas2 [Deltaproteobacteria bacterium]
MLVLVTYDVAASSAEGRKRLRRIAQACEDYGQRVQYSVFECKLGERDWVRLRARLLGEMDGSEDSLRFYFLDERAEQRTEHHGVRKPVDFDGPLVL